MGKLLTMCGYPGVGKSCLSRTIAERLGFARVSYDDLSQEMFGINPYFATREQTSATWNRFMPMRNEALARGDVVLDITAMNEDARLYLLWHELPKDLRYGQKYLLWLQAHPEILERRLLERGWGAGTTQRWKEKQLWEEPVNDGRIYTLLGPYDNNTTEDATKILQALEKEFARANNHARRSSGNCQENSGSDDPHEALQKGVRVCFS